MKFLKSDRGIVIICSAVLVLGIIAIAEIIERWSTGSKGVITPFLESVNWRIVGAYIVMISVGATLGAYAFVVARDRYLDRYRQYPHKGFYRQFRRPVSLVDVIVTSRHCSAIPTPTARLRCPHCEDTYPMTQLHACSDAERLH